MKNYKSGGFLRLIKPFDVEQCPHSTMGIFQRAQVVEWLWPSSQLPHTHCLSYVTIGSSEAESAA